MHHRFASSVKRPSGREFRERVNIILPVDSLGSLCKWGLGFYTEVQKRSCGSVSYVEVILFGKTNGFQGVL